MPSPVGRENKKNEMPSRKTLYLFGQFGAELQKEIRREPKGKKKREKQEVGTALIWGGGTERLYLKNKQEKKEKIKKTCAGLGP